MKSEVLYHEGDSQGLRESLSYHAEKVLCLPGLAFRGVFLDSDLSSELSRKQAYERTLSRLCDLGIPERFNLSCLAAFSCDYGSGTGGREFRAIYPTNDKTRLVVFDESEDRDHAYITAQVISLITEISSEERRFIDSEIKKLISIV